MKHCTLCEKKKKKISLSYFTSVRKLNVLIKLFSLSFLFKLNRFLAFACGSVLPLISINQILSISISCHF